MREMNMILFNARYFIATIVLLLVEIFIALYIKDDFIRPYIGDVLVVILIYCLLKSFLKIPVFQTCLAVLAFAFLIEWLQYLEIVKLLGVENNKLARIIIGTSFAWQDLLAYVAGILLVLIVEKTNTGFTGKKISSP